MGKIKGEYSPTEEPPPALGFVVGWGEIEERKKGKKQVPVQFFLLLFVSMHP